MQNTAERGGAIYASGAMLSIVNSEFSANSARTTGGAAYTADASALTVLNTTFTSNTAGASRDSLCLRHSISASLVHDPAKILQ